MSGKKFKIVTLGCRTNQYESQAFADQLRAKGYEAAAEDEGADVCIVNTCTVTASADAASRHAVRKLARGKPSKLVVTGCAADQVRELAGVTNVVMNADKEQLLNEVFPEEEFPEFSIKRFEAHTRAFVKVQDGCNSYCTYCIIPYVRGRSRSRTIAEIKQEVEELIANGFKEVVLTGINIGDFDGGDGQSRLVDLVRVIDAVPGLERLRISSIDPDEVDEELLDAVVNGQKTCQSMHIVLQAGSNVVLKRMNRKYTRQMFFEAVDRLKRASPDFTFTTDLIVGFPGETEADFAETLDAMRQVKFAKVHMFPYSERSRTRAALYPNKVPDKEKQRRKQVVMREAEALAYDLRKGYVGREMTILTEAIDPNDPERIQGHTDNFLMVSLPRGDLQPNQLVTVKLVENTPEGLIGE
ncbi:MAG: tRNA (N(6)-L-threonylcarbamoyladenosine(37)-C(2))-methylthiotransferase MtaB [Chlamydiia bacterium]|nr:tRNA (N(6)-L-threonylcarbamoyladenosine(37)-C(2))-methylthiotransferase MtaB [Chlamydiia bacterium]